MSASKCSLLVTCVYKTCYFFFIHNELSIMHKCYDIHIIEYNIHVYFYSVVGGN